MEPSFININEHFNLTTLESYIEEHPEDAEKWLEFLQEKDKLQYIRPTRDANTMITLDVGEDLECNLPSDFENVCIKCKRTWATTCEHPTTTLLCGHKYHTTCWFLNAYENSEECLFEGCGQSTYSHIREIARRRERMRVETLSVLTNTIYNKREFKFDIKKMKRQISSFSKVFKRIVLKQKEEKNKLMKKHIYSVRQIQSDMNETVSNLSKSEEQRDCLKQLRSYRRIEREIFRKYHLSLRDIIRRKLIKSMSWRMRSILERHGRMFIHRYKFGIRIYPGSKKWDLHDDSEDGQSDTDDDNNSDAAEDLPTTE